ncbi:MAG: hypothetical protein KBT46_02550 [Ruminococcus sp.]|nr:hypothetical protein [Candidatus Copronaster equi]
MNYIGKLGSKNTIIRRVWLTVIMIITFSLQSTDGLFPAPFGIHAMLLVPLTVCIAMFEREFSGVFFGLFAGLMLDAFNAQTVFFHSMCFTVIGFTTGSLITHLMRNNLTCATILTTFFTFIYNLLNFLIFFAFNGIEKPFLFYLKYFFISVIYTAVFTPVFYILVRFVNKKFKERE